MIDSLLATLPVLNEEVSSTSSDDDNDSNIIPHEPPGSYQPVRRFTAINNKKSNINPGGETRITPTNNKVHKKGARRAPQHQQQDQEKESSEESDEQSYEEGEELPSSGFTSEYEPTDEEMETNVETRFSTREQQTPRESNSPDTSFPSTNKISASPLHNAVRVNNNDHHSILSSPNMEHSETPKSKPTNLYKPQEDILQAVGDTAKEKLNPPLSPRNNSTIVINRGQFSASNNDKKFSTPTSATIGEKRKRVGKYVSGTDHWKHIRHKYEIPRLKRIIAHILETNLKIPSDFLSHDTKNKFLSHAYAFNHGYRFVGPREIRDAFERKAINMFQDQWNIIPLLLKHKILRVFPANIVVLPQKEVKFDKDKWVERVKKLKKGDDGWVRELGPAPIIDWRGGKSISTKLRPSKRRKIIESSSSEGEGSGDSDTPLIYKRALVPAWALEAAAHDASTAGTTIIQTPTPTPRGSNASIEIPPQQQPQLPKPPASNISMATSEGSGRTDADTPMIEPPPREPSVSPGQSTMVLDVNQESSETSITATQTITCFPSPPLSATSPPASGSSTTSSTQTGTLHQNMNNTIDSTSHDTKTTTSCSIPATSTTLASAKSPAASMEHQQQAPRSTQSLTTTSCEPIPLGLESEEDLELFNQWLSTFPDGESKCEVLRELCILLFHYTDGYAHIVRRPLISASIIAALRKRGFWEEEPEDHDNGNTKSPPSTSEDPTKTRLNSQMTQHPSPSQVKPASGSHLTTATQTEKISPANPPLASINVQVEASKLLSASPFTHSTTTQVEDDLHPTPSTCSMTTQVEDDLNPLPLTASVAIQAQNISVFSIGTQITPPKLSSIAAQANPQPPYTSTSTQTNKRHYFSSSTQTTPPLNSFTNIQTLLDISPLSPPAASEHDDPNPQFSATVVGIIHDFVDNYNILASTGSSSSGRTKMMLRLASKSMDRLEAKIGQFGEQQHKGKGKGKMNRRL